MSGTSLYVGLAALTEVDYMSEFASVDSVYEPFLPVHATGDVSKASRESARVVGAEEGDVKTCAEFNTSAVNSFHNAVVMTTSKHSVEYLLSVVVAATA